MSKNNSDFGYDPQDNLVSILPAVIAGMAGLSITIISNLLLYPSANELYRNGLIA